MRGRVVASVAVLSLVSLVASAARADDGTQAPKVDNRARAQELFDSALADAVAGNFASACPKFLASQAADPKTSTLLNLANCYEKNGQTASAWGAFREAETASHNAGRADWETTAKARADALEPKLLRLTIVVAPQVASRAPELVVTRDGARLAAGEYGVAIPVDPGDHVVTATAPSRVPWQTHVSVKDPSTSVAVPVLEESAEPPPVVPIQAVTPPPPPARPAPARSWWTPLHTTGVAVGGAGAATLITGTILGFVAKGDYDDAKARCTNGTSGCPHDAVTSSNAAFGLATGATVVFVVGAVALAGGAALVVLSPSSVNVAGRF